MIEVDEALALCLAQAQPLPSVAVPLDRSLGCVLAEEVASDVDSPPHDKSMVDGYAVIATDLTGQTAELQVLEEITAGENPSLPVKPGTASRIMTGAPIPPGADAVVMVEQTESASDTSDRVRIRATNVAARQNIMPRATSLRMGQVVLTAGRLIRPAEVALLAEVGRGQVSVIRQPTVAVVATGNELVPAGGKLAAGQIRNSNGPMLAAAVQNAGAEPRDLGIGRDEISELTQLVETGLTSDVLLLSGGVSMGVLDLIPQILADCGVQEVFHKVRLKPGKPIWFGICPSETGGNRLVFGLPGNPVSAFVCFELFVRPVLAILAGKSPVAAPAQFAKLSVQHEHHGNRPTYWPAELKDGEEGGTQVVTPLAWRGSADLRTLTDADCLAVFPAGDQVYATGDTVRVIPL